MKLANLETTITGKITEVLNYSGVYLNTILTPAADAYSYPSFFKVRSKSQIGRVGEEISDLRCRISGYRRQAKYKNKETQQFEKGYFFDVNLDHVVY